MGTMYASPPGVILFVRCRVQACLNSRHGCCDIGIALQDTHQRALFVSHLYITRRDEGMVMGGAAVALAQADAACSCQPQPWRVPGLTPCSEALSGSFDRLLDTIPQARANDGSASAAISRAQMALAIVEIEVCAGTRAVCRFLAKSGYGTVDDCFGLRLAPPNARHREEDGFRWTSWGACLRTRDSQPPDNCIEYDERCERYFRVMTGQYYSFESGKRRADV